MATEPRYRVSLLEGWTIGTTGRTPGDQNPITDAHVWDYDYTPPACVALFRSSGYVKGTGGRNPDGSYRGPPQRLGRDGAIREARALARRLNRKARRAAA